MLRNIPPLVVAIAVLFCSVSIEARPKQSTNSKAQPSQSGSALKQSLSPALKRLNRRMHEALREAVADERKRLGPLIMFEAGQIKLFRGDQEVAGFSISPPITYHRLKVIGHAAFGTVIQLQRSDLVGETRNQWLVSVANDLNAINAELADFGLPSALENAQRALIKRTLSLVRHAQTTPALSKTHLKSYTQEVLPMMQQAFTYSARAHIDLIHAQARKLYALLSPTERTQVRGYFYGGRGARAGNLALQYISWLVGENSGEESERIIFSEGIYDHDEALDALAKYSAERKLAQLVMGDPSGLHRDVLSEATRLYLATFPTPKIAFDID